MRIRILFAATAGAAACLIGPGLGGAQAPRQAECRSGYVDGIVGGERRCLHAGEFCSASRRADYARYGFACIAGHLRRGASSPPATQPHSGAVPTHTTLFARRTRTAGCVVRGPLPDRRCSPGAFYRDATLAMVCTSGYSARVRSVSESTKAGIYAEYGLPRTHYGRPYEIDHIVSLELGGSNDPANLYPEAASSPSPGFHDKDRLENRLHTLICTRRMALRQVQRGIAVNWVALYRRVFGVAPG
jgi:hypothetical protein